MMEVLYWFVTAVAFIGFILFCRMLAEDSFIAAFIVFVVAGALLVVMAMGLRDEIFGDHTYIHLRADRFACTERHTQVQTTYISGQNGQLTPIVSSVTICDQYSRIR